MADGQGQPIEIISKAQIAAALEAHRAGQSAPGIRVLDTLDLTQIRVPEDAVLTRPVVFSDHLVLPLQEGGALILLDAADADFLLLSEALVIPSGALADLAAATEAWTTLADAPEINLSQFRADGAILPASSLEPTDAIVNIPLEGLAISPLLPPTEFAFPEYIDDDVGGGPEAQVNIVQTGPVLRVETDANLQIVLSDFFEISAGQPEFGEQITEVGVTLINLPDGTISSAGTITNGTLSFVGSPAAFETLTLTFPQDFSTESRIDAAAGPLEGQIFANSSFGDGPVQDFPVVVLQEADLDMIGYGLVALTETDAPLSFRPVDAVRPEATDIDASEEVTQVQLTLNGLPGDALVSYDGGATFEAVPATLSFTGSPAEYALIEVVLPADFSTTNPATTVSGTVQAVTNEGGLEIRPLTVTVEATPDITLTAPALVSGPEDGDGPDGSGVTLDLGLDIAVDDVDGSEDVTLVTLSFTGLPDGTVASTGALSGQSWTGSIAEANGLSLTVPGDFSGTIPVTIFADNPEGSAGATQLLEIVPTGDIDLSVAPLVLAETDGPLGFVPSSVWQVGVSDADLSEGLTEVVLVLEGLPAGVLASGVPAGTVVYDAVAGGTLTFTGTGAEYAALQLTLPADFSTKGAPGAAAQTLTGTLSAVSNEGTAGPEPVSLTVTPEGDAEIDDSLPDTVPDETDGPTLITPALLLAPSVTDLDASEAIETLVLTVAGLPTDPAFGLAQVGGLPAGAVAELTVAADGSSTLVVSLAAADLGAGTLATIYDGITLSLPTDFSTANRTDLDAGTARALDLTLEIQTDEDADAGTDDAVDGTVVANRQVEIGVEADITLDAPAVVTVAEDGGAPGSVGVSVALGIEIAVTDLDGSETEDPSDPRFAAVVDITFGGLPAGTGVNGGTLNAAGDAWRGTVAEAEALILDLPGDFSGAILNLITVTTPEGVAEITQTVNVTATGDIDLSVAPLVLAETDGPLGFVPSSVWQVGVSDADLSEGLTEVVLVLEGLPAGVLASGVPAGTVVYDAVAGGTLTFTGTGAEYAALQLTLPADFSTKGAPGAAAQTLTGTLSAVSNEGTAGPEPVSLTVTPEGDAEIDDSLPDTVPDETDGPTLITPALLLAPSVTDLDASEAIETLVLTVAGLPTDPAFGLAQVGGLPAGAVAELTVAADGSSTLVVSLAAADLGAGTLATIYDGITLSLPTDFSTANRTDLDAGTARALDLTLEIQTDEDADAGTDDAVDGTVVANRQVEIGVEADITLDAPAVVTVAEDGGAPGSVGVSVALGIEIAVTDLDGSETEDPSDPRFAAVVDITFGGLPAGTGVNGGTLNAAGDAWRGTVAEAEALILDLPGDFSGAILNLITVTTPEGVAEITQTVNVTATGDIDLSVAPLVLAETDGPLGFVPSSVWQVGVSDADLSEGLTEVVLVLEGLPAGVLASGVPAGTVVYDAVAGGTLTFTGTGAEYAALQLTLPADFSTKGAPGAAAQTLTGTLSAVSNEGTAGPEPVSLTVTPEGDAEIDDSLPDTVPDETDGPTLITPALLLAPSVTDLDASEAIETLVLTVAGLPTDPAFGLAQVGGLPAGAVAELTVAADGSSTLVVSLAAADLGAGTLATIYDGITLSLPTDFSTANRTDLDAGTARALDLTLEIQTDEDADAGTDDAVDGTVVANRQVEIGVEADITLDAPAVVTVAEDGGAPGSVGVSVALGIEIAVTDLDGSETEDPSDPRFAAVVDITFGGLPAGTGVNGGTLNAAGDAWRGTVAEAEALILDLPGDFSGAILNLITVTTPEGVAEITQTVNVTATGDIDLSVAPLVLAETDGPLGFVPSSVWQVGVSDADLSEGLTEVVLVLEGLPAGVLASGVPAGTVVYDAVAGGTLTFTGTGAEYAALQLTLPADFSTKGAPGAAAQTLTGTLSAVSNEGTAGPEPVSLTVTPEGDAEIDDSLPDTVPDETDGPTLITPALLLAPSVTDLDASEAIETLVLTVAGLPTDPAFGLAQVGGLPAGAVAELTVAADGSSTLVVSLAAADLGAGTLATIYDGITLSLPTDFSTANRTDLDAGTARALDLTLEIQTDEDADAGTDDAVDGTVVANRQVEIGVEADITLDAPAVVTVAEDGGAPGSVGVSVALGIEIAVTDLDGSETEDPSDPRFAAVVDITFGGLPAGTGVNGGTLNAAGDAWRGTVAEAEALILDLPGDFSGAILNLITVTTPEGAETTIQTLVVEPTPDVIILGDVETIETDAAVTILLSDFIDVVITDPDETVTEVTFVLPDLPVGTSANAGTFVATGPDTVRFEYAFVAANGDPSPETVTLTFPQDYSSTSPAQVLEGTLSVTTDAGGPTVGAIPVTVNFEGDVAFADGALALAETDAPIQFRPADAVTPGAIDLDGSEQIEQVAVAFDTLPAGARFSIDGGATFEVASPTLGFTGTLAEYELLVIELPGDFSTESPGTTLTAEVVAVSNEAVGPQASGSAILTVTVAAEGDIALSGTGTIALSETDAPGDTDDDATTQAPLRFRPADAVQGAGNDADGSESIAEVDVVITGLPAGATYSIGGGFAAVPVGGILPTLTAAEYAALQIELPADFSTESPASTISGTVTFRTDEALLAGETDTGAADGVETGAFTVTVADEADVDIQVADITVTEDIIRIDPGVSEIPLNIDAVLTDLDLSEAITGASVSFAGLPTNGPTELSDGTILTGPTATWSGSFSDAQMLAVTSLPEHYSGVITVTATVETDEGNPAGTSASFALNVTPVAEPEIVLSVDATEPQVIATGADSFVVDEDTSFLLLIDATTPDQDGSETLTRIVIENVPAGWLPNGAVDPGLIEVGSAQVASANFAGGQLVLTLNGGLDSFTGAVRVTPTGDEDRDVATIVGAELTATVTAVDTAAGLADNSATASDSIDLDLDAIVDPIDLTVANSATSENVDGRRSRPLNITNVALQDTDGSEGFDALEVTLTIATESDPFDPTNTNLLALRVSDSTLQSFVSITQTGATADSVTYRVEPTATASDAQFANALESLQIRVGQHVSGVIETEGTVFWSETRTGDVEIDVSDNAASADFNTTVTFRPVAEAELTASVFVTDTDFVADGTTTVTGTADDTDAVANGTLTLRESTDDGSGPGQVSVFVGIDARTPDLDGSETLQQVVISNIPTSWIDGQLSGTTLAETALFTRDGTGPLAPADLAKIASAEYVAATGELTLTFVPDVAEFEAAVQLQPALYEDYDVDRENTDPFTADGDFFATDLRVALVTRDDNSAETATASASVTLDVDVDPVNNTATIATIPLNFEDVVDAAGGVAQIPLQPTIRDMDGSETITAVVLNDVPDNLSVYASDPANPGGPKVPVLLTAVNDPAGFNTWSLENGQWLDAEVRGVFLHAAGDFPVEIFVVTTEADGNGTGVTQIDSIFRVEPVVDGGTPDESASTLEDTAVRVEIDGNLIDNTANSPDSPEAILDAVIVRAINPDAFGRYPRFFNGEPEPTPGSPGDFDNELGLTIPVPGGDGSITLTAAQASNLWVLPGQDSNETIEFEVEVVYFETLKPTEAVAGIGTVTIDVTGIADTPIVDAQDAAAFGASSVIDEATFRPQEVVDGTPNSERVYGYAGYDNTPFLLDSRLTDMVIDTGVITNIGGDMFTQADVDPLSGTRTEILVPEGDPAPDFDGSESLYYVITGVPAGVSFANATPVDPNGESFVVSAAQLNQLTFIPDIGVSEVTYYDMTLNAIVLEDDQDVPDFTGLDQVAALAEIDALPGGAVSSVDFTVVVLPFPGGTGGTDCTPEQELPLPVLTIEGAGLEDTEIPLTISIAPNPPFWSDISDLATLPNGVVGSLGVAIRIPPGSSLSATDPSAVLFDPVTGLYAVDFAALGVDGTDPTMTAETLLFTPPPHESSPDNPFDAAETFGPGDPYDALDELEVQFILNNFTCGTTETGSSSVSLTIIPVADGPLITFDGSASVLEDTDYAPGITIQGIDPGERLTGQITVEVDATNGGALFDATGTALTGTPIAGGVVQYSLDAADLPGLVIRANEHYSGPLELSVSATSEDINGTTNTRTATQTIDIVPVADTPVFAFDSSDLDPDTGLPFVDESQSPVVIQAIEDVPYTLADGLLATSPDQDGSEVVSIVLSGVPGDLLVQAGPGAPSGGIINNGDGSFTISQDAYPFVQLILKDEHARTPDLLDPSLSDEIPLSVTVNTFELDNADQNSATTDFVFKVRPDADLPVLTTSIAPQAGAEDDGTAFALSMSATTTDPHETMEFVVSVTPGAQLFLNGVEQIAQADGSFVLPGGAPVQGPGGATTIFGAAGAVTLVAGPDFAGDLSASVTAVTIDESTDGSFADRQPSATVDLDVTITPTPDLVVDQTDDTIVLGEGDAPDQPSFRPADEIAVTVTDQDGSELIDSLVYTLVGVPVGTTYTLGGAPVSVAGADLVFSGTQADFALLEVQFPVNYATNGTPLPGTLQVTTDEGGDETVSFSVEVTGELDLAVTVTPMDAAQTGAPLSVALGIDAEVLAPQTTGSETLDEIVVTFDAPLPVGALASAGVLSGDRTTVTLTRGATPVADFALLVAALAVTVPGDFSGPLTGAVVAASNHGTLPPVDFAANINDQPEVTGPVDLGATTQTSLIVPVADLLATSSDPDGLAGISNLASDSGDVIAVINGANVEITIENDYSGPVTLTYDVSDSGVPIAVTEASATLDVTAQTQLVASGTTMTGPDGTQIPIVEDASGGAGPADIALGTGAGEAVVVAPGVRDYAGIESFAMLDGNDLVDLSAATTGFDVDLGAGDDAVIGGQGVDTLTGGAGADTFGLGVALDITDVITDYEAGIDQIDLSTVLTGSDTLDGRVTYDSGTGDLTVLGDASAQIAASGGGIPASVEVIFENASGAQVTAVI